MTDFNQPTYTSVLIPHSNQDRGQTTMFVKDNGTIEGEGWWIYLLSALINGNAQDIVDKRTHNFYLYPEPEHDYKLALKVGLSGLISGLRQLARTGMTDYRSPEEGVHEHALNHRLLGPISFCWTASDASFSLRAKGRPIFTAQSVTRQSATTRWHFADPLQREVERIINCPTGKFVSHDEVVDGWIPISRPEEGDGWLNLLKQLWFGNAEEILSSRNINPFLLPDERHSSRLPGLAGHRGFIRIFEHIARSRHATCESLGRPGREYTCLHHQIGGLRWRYEVIPSPTFQLDVDGTPLLRSVENSSGVWQVHWLSDNRLKFQVEGVLGGPAGNLYFGEWWE